MRIPVEVISRVETSPVSRRTTVVAALVAVAVPVATVPTFLVDGLLRGTPVMNGSARGTALVMVLVALPALLGGLAAAMSGSVRGRAVLLGAIAYTTYNAMLFVYATPFNELFLVYVALLGLAFWSLVSTLLDGVPVVEARPTMHAPALAGFLLVVVVLNVLAWLSMIVPSLGEDPPGFLEGTGLLTNPIHAQDLALWLPAMVIIAVLLLRGHPSGPFLVGAGLVFWLVEAVGVAVDQWFGHRAAPDSDVATLGGAVLFAVMTLVTLVPLVVWLRAVPGRPGRAPG